MFEYAVAYTVANPVTKVPTAAGAALAQALAAADNGKTSCMVLPILLASSQVPVVADFSLGEWSCCQYKILAVVTTMAVLWKH